MFSSARQNSDRGVAFDRARWQVRAVAIASAVVLNVVILTVGRIVNGAFPVANGGDDDQSIEFPHVILVTLLIGLVAWGLLALLERTTGRAATIWLAVAIVFFVVSLFGPLANGEDTFSKLLLALMHVGAFITIVPAFWRSTTSRSG